MQATNKKVIAERGWGPLNYILLDNKELANTQQQASDGIAMAYQLLELAGSEPIYPDSLNTSHGMAGTLMERFVSCKSQDRA